MNMTPRLTKLTLTTHITCSVGWLGTVASFFVLSIAGLTSRDVEVVRGSYQSMNLMGLYIIVPLSLAALLTGLIQSLGTQWGLFRHWWVLMKFLLTIGATSLLMLHQFTAVEKAARRVAAVAPGTLPQIGGLGTELVTKSGMALVLLFVITTLSVFKPWGRTAYGRRKQQELREGLGEDRVVSASLTLGSFDSGMPRESVPFGLKAFIAVIAAFVLVFAVMHLTGQGFHHGH